MKKIVGFFAFAAVTAIPIAGQPATGMAAMQYYVGSWSCTGGTVGKPAVHATLTYTLDSGVLREWATVPAQGTMKATEVYSLATSYDAKKGRYVQTFVGNDGSWSVSAAQPWSGDTEQWTDISSSTGKLGRGDTVRTDQNAFVFTGYPTTAAAKPDFKASCHRS